MKFGITFLCLLGTSSGLKLTTHYQETGIATHSTLKGLRIFQSSIVSDIELPGGTFSDTNSWVEKVLGSCSAWKEMENTTTSTKTNDVVQRGHEGAHHSLPTVNVQLQQLKPCAERSQECNEARQKLTTASCQAAPGYTGGSRDLYGSGQVCIFNNIYSSGLNQDGWDRKLVAHIVKGMDSEFPTDETISKIRVRSNLFTGARDNLSPVFVQKHASLEAFTDYLAKSAGPVQSQPGLTLAVDPSWHNNIGHALYDTMYPAFTSLIQLGLHEEEFRLLLFMGPIDPNYASREIYEANEGVLGTIAGSGILRTAALQGVHVFEKVVAGQGPNSQEFDVNANFTLGSSRSLDAARIFRKRVYSAFGIEPPSVQKTSNEGLASNQPVKGLLINSGRVSTNGWGDKAVELARKDGVELDHIHWWHDINKANPAESGIATFREHLQKLVQARIHISGPGTTMMYQQFLPEGSVVVNLGSWDGRAKTKIFMDEYMAEGAPYLRAIYAVSDRSVNAEQVAGLAVHAKNLVRSGFQIPVEPGLNLSPNAAVMKAYAHLTMGNCKSLDPQTPLRAMEEFQCFDGVVTAHLWVLNNGMQDCPARYPKILHALRKDFNQYASVNWFKETAS